MTNDELIYITAIGILFRSTPRRARQLLETYSTPAEAWSEIGRHLVTERQDQIAPALERARNEIDFISRHALHTYYYKEEDYPYRLRECADAPILLFGKGNIEPNKGKFVSIVGTRHATERGREQTTRLVRDLAQLVPDVTIVSGLAYGIDVAAHRAAIEVGLPTLMITAHGLDRIYPPMHRQVAIDALSNGGILTEYPSGTEPEKGNFVARNRIVAGLSDATVVMESREKGGSLITAGLSLDYGREVMAFPGRPGDIESAGCNQMIRQLRATLITSAEDLVDVMQWDTAESKAEPVQTDLFADTELSETEQQIFHLIRSAEDGLHINLIVTSSGLPYPTVAATLGMMELSGLVKSLPGGVYRAQK